MSSFHTATKWNSLSVKHQRAPVTMLLQSNSLFASQSMWTCQDALRIQPDQFVPIATRLRWRVWDQTKTLNRVANRPPSEITSHNINTVKQQTTLRIWLLFFLSNAILTLRHRPWPNSHNPSTLADQTRTYNAVSTHKWDLLVGTSTSQTWLTRITHKNLNINMPLLCRVLQLDQKCAPSHIQTRLLNRLREGTRDADS